MVDVAQSLQMFVSFAVKLEVGFQVGSVIAEVAQVVTSYDNGNLVLSGSTSVM